MASVTALRSISFSGAGFLGCYHVGVAACLLHQGYLAPRGKLPSRHNAPILTGVSAGSIVVSGVSAGVEPEDAMNVVFEVGRRTREAGGVLDALQPGFSLIDQVEDLLLHAMKVALGGTASSDYDDYDRDLLMGRTKEGRLLRIGLTNRKVFPPFGQNQRAYFYVDAYRDVEDVLAACILSSYVPGLTGPALGSNHNDNLAVNRAMTRIKEMEQLGFIKNGITGKPFGDKEENDGRSREVYWDGGLVNVWPTIDHNTVVVTPVCGNFDPNPSICPQPAKDDDETRGESGSDNASGSSIGSLFGSVSLPSSLRVSHRAEIFLCQENMDTLRRMILSSDETILQERFSQGYSDAKNFLDRNNLLNVHTTTTAVHKGTTNDRRHVLQ